MLLYSLVDVTSTFYVAVACFMLPKNLAPLFFFIKFLVALVIRLHLCDADMLWTVRIWPGFGTFSCPTFPHKLDITARKVDVIDSRAHHRE